MQLRCLVLMIGLMTSLLLLASACSESQAPAPPVGRLNSKAIEAASEGPVVLCLGDSLTAGYGLDDAEAWPQRLAEKLAASGQAARVINAGVSGDTSGGGLARLAWVLRAQPDLVILCLGANDGLRGIDPALTEANLRQLIEGLQAAEVRVLLAGMQLPRNYGNDHTEAFAAIFPRLAADYDLAFIPFLLEGVAMRQELNLSDGIHPNAAGHAQIADNVHAALLPLLLKQAEP